MGFWSKCGPPNRILEWFMSLATQSMRLDHPAQGRGFPFSVPTTCCYNPSHNNLLSSNLFHNNLRHNNLSYYNLPQQFANCQTVDGGAELVCRLNLWRNNPCPAEPRQLVPAQSDPPRIHLETRATCIVSYIRRRRASVLSLT